MSFDDTNVNQSGKSGGDATGMAGSSGFACGGAGAGGGGASSSSFGSSSGTGVGIGGDASASSAAGQSGGDVSDNTSIGSINIGS